MRWQHVKIKKEEAMANKKTDSPHANLSIIKEDLEVLKDDMVEDGTKLFQDIKEQSMLATKDVQRKTRQQIAELRSQIAELESAAEDSLHSGLGKLERHVKSRPTESVALAFAAGIVASLFLSRRH